MPFLSFLISVIRQEFQRLDFTMSDPNTVSTRSPWITLIPYHIDAFNVEIAFGRVGGHE